MDGVIVGWMPESAGVQSCPLQVMLSQKKIKARRKRRKELFVGQMCFMGLLVMVVSGLSHFAENSGESTLTLNGQSLIKSDKKVQQSFHGTCRKLAWLSCVFA